MTRPVDPERKAQAWRARNETPPEGTAADRALAQAIVRDGCGYCGRSTECQLCEHTIATALATARAEGRAAWVELEDCRSYVAEIAQGVSHYPHDDGEPCVRCEHDTLQARVAALEAALRALVTTYESLFDNDPRGNAVKFEDALAVAKALAPDAGGTA